MDIKRYALQFGAFITLVISGITVNSSSSSFQILATLEDNEWNVERIEEALGVSLPHHAIDLVYEGEWGRLTELTLSFKAPPDVMDQFTKHFCQGVVHQNYNPFDAINVADAISDPFAVELHTPFVPFSYYSYSPNASPTIFGNRCFGVDIEVFKIAIDQSNPEIYALEMEYLLGGGVPVLDIKLANSPFLFRGFRLREGQNRLVFNHFCMEIDPLEFINDKDGFSGKKVNLSLDNQLLTSAFISDTGLLIPFNSNITGLEEVSTTYFTYCYDTRYLQDGPHTLAIIMDDTQTYSWGFYKT